MRLAKYLAGAGVASRRRAEKLIEQGRVRVNGKIVVQCRKEVTDKDTVTVDGCLIEGMEKKHYILLHKPAGYISTVQDTHNRPTVIELLKGINVRLYPAGRLDFDTSGALLMSNDGELVYRLTHPRFRVKKVYRARVAGIPDEEAIRRMSGGIMIDRRITSPASARLLKTAKNGKSSLLEITLNEGRKRQIKQMCAAVGHRVIHLHRVQFAGLTADNLPEGSYRYLSKREIEELYRLVGL